MASKKWTLVTRAELLLMTGAAGTNLLKSAVKEVCQICRRRSFLLKAYDMIPGVIPRKSMVD
jgi:hypothetical protein